MIIEKRGLFWTGVGIIALMILFYFIPIPVDVGINYITIDSILGIIIFHNVFILTLYFVIAVILVAAGLRFTKNNGNNHKMKGGMRK